MTHPILSDHEGNEILDWRDWVRPQLPERQWKCGRSAMELARAWFTSPHPVVPQEITALLDSHPLTRGTAIIRGWPEMTTPLPGSSDGPRHHDLVLRGQQADTAITICIEAKADEPFDSKTIGQYLERTRGGSSKVPRRICELVELVFGLKVSPGDSLPPHIAAHPYQLLSATAGTILQASLDQSPIAVFVVHEFQTTATDSDRLQRNHSEFLSFMGDLPGLKDEDIRVGRLHGPVNLNPVEEGQPRISLLVGKAVYRWT